MNTEGMSDQPEIRRHFEDQLEAIRTGIVELGILVHENLERVGRAILTNDMDALDAVTQADGVIDRRYAALEGRTFDVMARQQPVAKDLRLLVAATRMLYEIERSGDLVVNALKATARGGGLAGPDDLVDLTRRLIAASGRVFRGGIDALAGMDSTAGSRLDQEDDEVDDHCSAYYKALAEESETIGLARAVELSKVGRYLERIADHGVNVAENVTYIMTGRWPRLVSPSHDTRIV
jgi:phosphate transport system protein